LYSWLAGSLLWLGATAWRVRRFRRLLRFARPAPPELGERACALAGRLGLRRCPGVWLVPGPVSPMLWALGGPARLLLPHTLWQRLDDDQRDALLVHELAHYRRRDHWLRFVELIATGLYWWHPVVWWARHELRAAEEECCDAWVVWALPAAARAYSLALLETMTFLGEAPPLGVPAQSGIGHLHTLKRRLTMIMRGTTPRALSWTGCFAVFGLGVVLLPWLPTRAASEPPDSPVQAPAQDDPFTRASARQATRLGASESVCARCHQVPLTDPHRKLMPTHDELVRLMDEVNRDRKLVADAAARLREAQSRLADNEKKLQDATDRFERLNDQANHPTKPVALPPDWAKHLFTERSHDCGVVPHYSTYQYAWRIHNPHTFHVHLNGVRVSAGCVTVTPQGLTLDPGQDGALDLRVDARRFTGTKTFTVFVSFDQPARAEVRLQVKATTDISRPEQPQRAGQAERDRRVDELERKLDALRKEIEELRRKDQSRGNPPGVNPFSPTPGPTLTVPAPGTAPQNPFANKYYAPVVPLKPGQYGQWNGADLEKLKLNPYQNPEKLKLNLNQNLEKLKLNGPDLEKLKLNGPDLEKLKLNPYHLPQPSPPGQGGQNAGK
jgi:hypothetical protein